VVVVMGVGAVVDEADSSSKVLQATNWRHECTDAMFA
jgi:hypothetical protein